LRTNVRMLALATAAYMTAVITCSSSYLWHQPAPQLQLHNTWLDWQTLQQAVASTNARPAQVWLQQHPGNTRANLAQLQQSLTSFQALIDAAQRGLADPQCILQQLPPFEDATECWLLHGQCATAAAVQRMCIHTLRRRISEASLSPFQLMCHADEPQQLVWVMDLVLLRLVDAAYGEMQEQEQEQAAAADAYQQQHQQQQQQQAGVMQRQHSGQQQQQQLQLSRAGSYPPGLQQRLPQPPLPSPRVLSPGKGLHHHHHQQQQQQLQSRRGEAIPAEAPLTPSPVGEPAAGAAPADAEAAAAAAAAESLLGPSPNHVPRSIVASAFPAQMPVPFAWPGMRVRSRVVLRRSFVGCEDALYMTDDEEEEEEGSDVQLAESQDEGLDSAPPGAQQQQQQQDEDVAAAASNQQAAEEQQQQEKAVSPAVSKQEQQQQQRKSKGGRPRKRTGEAAAVLESCLAELDPATAAAAKEAMYGIRRSTRGEAAAPAAGASEAPAAADAAAAEVQPRPRKRRASLQSTPDSAAEVAAAVAGGRQQRSRSATPAVESAAAAAAGDAMQDQLQALAADEDMDDDTRAAIQAAMLGLRGTKQHKEQQQQQAAAAGSNQRAGSAKRSAAAAAAAGSSKAAAAAASRPAKRGRKAAAAAAAAAVGPGCGRAIDLQQMRQAAATTKLQGFCRGLTQALEARKRSSNAADAAAGLLQENGYLMAVPYGLPACLLSLDGSAPGPSVRTSQAGQAGGLTGHQAGSSSSSSAAAGGGSRGQRSQLRAMVKGEAGSSLSEAAKWKNLVARSKKVVFERSGVHGWGLFAGEEIAADEFIIQYVGELIRPVLSDTRERMYEAAGQDSSYLFR
jgi:hypothetical protein